MAGRGSPASTDDGDDDAHLTAFGAAALIRAIYAGLPDGAVAVSEAAMMELNGPNPPACDPRIHAFYTDETYLTTLRFCGANAVLAQGGDPHDRRYSRALALAAVADRLERRATRLIAAGIARFRGEAAAAKGDRARLRTPANLALQWALLTAASWANAVMARFDAARALAAQLADIWRATGVPRHVLRDDPEWAGWTLDDLLWVGLHVDAFWSGIPDEMMLAMTTGTPLAYDPPRDFGEVPVNCPAKLLWEVPPPSKRPIGGPIPAHLPTAHTAFTVRDVLGFLDPTLRPAVDPALRTRVLDLCVGDFVASGVFHLMTISCYASCKVAEFLQWLKEDAGLTILDLLLAEEMTSRSGALSPHGSDAGEAPRAVPEHVQGMDRRFVERIFRRPLVNEALRRHRHFRDALAAVFRSLPPAVAAAERDSDYRAFAAAVPYLDTGKQQLVLSCLATLRQTGLQLVSPAPFEDLDGWGRSLQDAGSASRRGTSQDEDDGESASDLGSVLDSEVLAGEVDALRSIWFRSSSFSVAHANAIVIARSARMMAERFTPEELGANIFITFVLRAAVAATWLFLLILRRFPALAADAPHEDRARAAALHASILTDVRACLELLRVSGKPAFQDVRILLERIVAEGDPRPPTPAELGMLRAARRAARRCPHVDALGSLEGGECYVCAAARAAEAEGEVLEDPLARIGREARARGSGKRVRFGGEVRVFGTWSRSEYPRRERDGQEHGEAEELGSSELGAGSSDELEGDGALGMMLQAREGTMAEAMWTWQTAPLKGPGPEESGSVITDSDGSSDLAVDWVAGSADVRPSIS